MQVIFIADAIPVPGFPVIAFRMDFPDHPAFQVADHGRYIPQRINLPDLLVHLIVQVLRSHSLAGFLV